MTWASADNTEYKLSSEKDYSMSTDGIYRVQLVLATVLYK